jgi:hypothetical protein
MLAVNPPQLTKCVSVVDLWKFEQEYKLYFQMGGEIPVFCCLSGLAATFGS